RSVAPSPFTSLTAADLARPRPGVWATGVSVEDGGDVTLGPDGGWAEAVAVVATWPASTSGWLIVYGSGVDVRCAPGARGGVGHETAPAVGSFTATDVSVVVPVLRTTNDQRMVSPRSVTPLAFTSVTAADLARLRLSVCATGVSVDDGGEV